MDGNLWPSSSPPWPWVSMLMDDFQCSFMAFWTDLTGQIFVNEQDTRAILLKQSSKSLASDRFKEFRMWSRPVSHVISKTRKFVSKKSNQELVISLPLEYIRQAQLPVDRELLFIIYTTSYSIVFQDPVVYCYCIVFFFFFG